MGTFLVIYGAICWLVLAAVLWATWYQVRKPMPDVVAVLVLIVFIALLPALYLERLVNHD